MSRFNNPKALTAVSATVPGLQSPGEPTSSAVSTLNPKEGPDQAAPAAVTFPEIQPSGLHQFCFITLCLYLLSAYANEFSYRLLNSKAYISTITIALLPILFVVSGGIIQSVQVPLAKWYLAFGAWLAVAAPFSSWKSNTLTTLFTFYSKSFLLYFVICACVLRIREVKKLILVLGIGTAVVVFSCFKYGHVDEEARFSVAESVYSFMANANELALGLILGILALLVVLLRGKKLMRAISFCVIVAALYYALRTASRAGFLSIIAALLAWFWLSKHKAKLALLAVVLIPAVLLLLPAETRHRLFFIAVAGHRVEVTTEVDRSSIDSQNLRELKLLDSIRLTLTHPLFGVGPGDFVAAESAYQESAGQRSQWVGTHNSYTQVSSESGIPAFIFYVASIVACVRMNYRGYKRTLGAKGLEDYAAVSFCMFLSIIAYAVGSFFDQLAYSTYLPIIAGVSSANYFAIRHALGGSLDAKTTSRSNGAATK
jgi:O-antigen ligase